MYHPKLNIDTHIEVTPKSHVKVSNKELNDLTNYIRQTKNSPIILNAKKGTQFLEDRSP